MASRVFSASVQRIPVSGVGPRWCSSWRPISLESHLLGMEGRHGLGWLGAMSAAKGLKRDEASGDHAQGRRPPSLRPGV